MSGEKEGKRNLGEGDFFLGYGLNANGVAVSLYGKDFAGIERKLGQGKMDEEGHFKIIETAYESEIALVTGNSLLEQGRSDLID